MPALDNAEHDQLRKLGGFSKTQLADTLADLFGLFTLVMSRENCDPELKAVIRSNHRYFNAADLLVEAGYIKAEAD